jgi:large subunit ribosomal protein L29
MTSATELRELHDEELADRLGEYRKELLNLRFQLATGQLDNPARLGQVRRDVARVLTLLRDREIAMAEGRLPVSGAPADSLYSSPRRARRTRGAADEEFETEAEVRTRRRTSVTDVEDVDDDRDSEGEDVDGVEGTVDGFEPEALDADEDAGEDE